MLANLQLKLSKERRSLRKNSVMLVHQNENIQPAYLEEANKVLTTFQMKYEKIVVRCHLQCSKIIVYLIKQMQTF